MSAKENILIIEDEEAIRTGLTDVLIYHGFDTDYAEDGKAGLKKALTGKYDLILLDIMLPGMDGYQVCEKLKADKRTTGISVIFINGLDETFDKVQHGDESTMEKAGRKLKESAEDLQKN